MAPTFKSVLAIVTAALAFAPMTLAGREVKTLSTNEHGLPAQAEPRRWRLPYEVLPAPTSAGNFIDHLNAASEAVWKEGDVLTFACRSKADVVRLAGSVQAPMNQLEGTDVWVLQLRMPDWDAVRVKYRFFTSDGTGDVRYWQGAEGPRPLVRAEKLKGKILERSFRSSALGEERKLTVYLPPDAPKQGLSAFFMADGQSCQAFAEVLEPLIIAKKVRPTAIIGVNSGNAPEPGIPKPGENIRAMEYVPGKDLVRFQKHLDFFAGEVPEWATREFGVSPRRADRAIFGYSDGGSFTASAVLIRPAVFGAAMPLSAGIPPKVGKPTGPLPAFYFAAGRLERFSIPTETIHKQIQQWGGTSIYKSFFSGHDEDTWLAAFAEYAPMIFPNH